MRTYLTAIPVLLTFIIASCNSGGTHDDHATPSTVTLDNGKKWQANAETTSGISNMEKLLSDFPAEATIEEYHALKANLENEFDQIIQQCTMSGEAHNQLHNFLMPLKEMIEKLDSTEAGVCSEAVDELKNHIAQYSDFFE